MPGWPWSANGGRPPAASCSRSRPGPSIRARRPLPPLSRELAEECGLAADGWEEGPAFYTAPGFCTERLTLFLATGLRPHEAAAPDDEEIERSWISLADALAAIDEGRIIDAKSLAGILWLARRVGAARG